MSSLRNLYLTLTVGQSVRDFLIIGTARRLLDILPDFRIVILSPAYNVPEFLDLCPRDERLLVRRTEIPNTGSNWRFIHWRLRLHNRNAIRLMLDWESRRLRLPPYLASTFQELPPSLVVTTHPRTTYEYDIVMRARRLGVQTLGVVKSWDNIGKGLSSQPHLLCVWNPVNKQEASDILCYRQDEVEITGSPSFDAYFDNAYCLPRSEFFHSMGLDPSRPLITLATVGIMDRGFYGRDETHLVDDMLRMIKESPILKKAQLMIRLHPNSRLDFFWKYWNRADIKFSFVSYMPGILWCPNRQDLMEQTNLLRHSDVIVTPTSSWGLEAAIFDRPTVVPVYSDLQPDHATAQFDEWSLARHYKPLMQNNWVPITRSYEETRKSIEDGITEPAKYAGGRKSIVENYIYYRDNSSCQRVAAWIANIARSTRTGKTRGF